MKPLRVPIRVDGVYEEARNLVEDLPQWKLVTADDAAHVLVCKRAKRFLSGEATVTITCDGPADLPSTTVSVRSESNGGLLSRDKANVLEFMVPFHRRVC